MTEKRSNQETVELIKGRIARQPRSRGDRLDWLLGFRSAIHLAYGPLSDEYKAVEEAIDAEAPAEDGGEA